MFDELPIDIFRVINMLSPTAILGLRSEFYPQNFKIVIITTAIVIHKSRNSKGVALSAS